MDAVQEFVCFLLFAYIIALFVRIVLSWFSPDPGSGVASIEEFLRRITDPVLVPVRRVVPRAGMLDLSPLVVLLVIQLIRDVLC